MLILILRLRLILGGAMEWDGDGWVRRSYEEGGHDPVRLREFLKADLLREGEHDVQEDHEAGRFHCRPAYFPGDI